MRSGVSGLGLFVGGDPETNVALSAADYVSDVSALIESGSSRSDADLIASGYRSFVKPWDATIDNSYLYEALAIKPQLTIEEPADAQPYTLVLDGYGVLPYWTAASWVCKVNAPDELTIEYPADQQYATMLCRPNTVSLFTGGGMLIQSFDFVNALPDISRDGGSIKVQAKAESRLGRLRRSWIDFYAPGGSKITADISETDTAIVLAAGQGALYAAADDILLDNERMTVDSVSGDTLTVTRAQQLTPASKHSAQTLVVKARSIAAHVRALLSAYPVDGFPISIDLIDPALESVVVAITIENCTLYDAIERLWTLSGMSGMYQVTNSGRFAWLPSLGGSGAINLGVNLLSVSRSVDDSNLCTRLYAYGAGASRESRVKLSDLSGVDVDYVENGVASFGVIPQSFTSTNIKDAATLKTVADSYITIMSSPYLSYTATAADLEALNLGKSPTIGSAITITDSDLNIATEEKCLSIERDLSDPTAVAYTFAKYTRDLSDIIEEQQQQIAAAEARDIAGELASELSGGYDSPFTSGIGGTSENISIWLDDPRNEAFDMATRSDRAGLPLLMLSGEADLSNQVWPAIAYCDQEDTWWLYSVTREKWVSIPWVQKDTDDVYRGYYAKDKGVPEGFTHFLYSSEEEVIPEDPPA